MQAKYSILVIGFYPPPPPSPQKQREKGKISQIIHRNYQNASSPKFFITMHTTQNFYACQQSNPQQVASNSFISSHCTVATSSELIQVQEAVGHPIMYKKNHVYKKKSREGSKSPMVRKFKNSSPTFILIGSLFLPTAAWEKWQKTISRKA